MNAAQIRDVDLRARAKFSYLADPPGYDNWRSHAADVEAGRAWQGDCDDLASTTLDLLGRAGLPLGQLYRLCVTSPQATNGPGVDDHQIGCVWDDAGAAWIVGDTYGEAYPAKDCPHRTVRYQSLDDIFTWRDGAPWV